MEDPHHVHVSGDARLTAILNAEIFRMVSQLVPALLCRLVVKMIEYGVIYGDEIMEDGVQMM